MLVCITAEFKTAFFQSFSTGIRGFSELGFFATFPIRNIRYLIVLNLESTKQPRQSPKQDLCNLASAACASGTNVARKRDRRSERNS